MMRKLVYALALLALISCGTNTENQQVENGTTEKKWVKVVAVNYPLHYFAERIAGDLIQLDYPIPANVDPAYWIPQDSSLSIYQSADIILSNGADYAKWMNNVSLPASRIVNTTALASEKLIEVQQGASHSHGSQGEHVHTGFAFTTWLNFEIAQIQASAVKDALLKKLPEHQEAIENNYNQLKVELAQLHTDMKTIGEQLHDHGILGSHPVYQYLAQAYHLHINSVHFEPAEMPSKGQWKEFDHEISHHPAKIMLWEGEPLAEARAKIEQKGIQVVVFNPCSNQPEQGDFMSIMQDNIKGLSR